MPVWTLLDHLDAPPRVGASLRKMMSNAQPLDDDEDDEDSTPRRIETLRDILGLPRPPIKLLRYRGMGLKSVKWLFAELKSRYQLEFDYDWAAHVPDVRPLEVLEPLLAELEQKIEFLKSERRSLKAIIAGKKSHKSLNSQPARPTSLPRTASDTTSAHAP